MKSSVTPLDRPPERRATPTVNLAQRDGSGETRRALERDRFAVVIPAYNAAKYLEGTILSALSAGAGLAAVIVVDDGSTDATATIAAGCEIAFPQVTLIRQANGGVARARNAGLDRVEAEYVCFLDADDLLRPGALDLLRQCLRDHADAAAAFGRVGYIDPDSNRHPLVARPKPLPSSIGLPDVLSSNFVDTPGAILFRTEAVRMAGGFVPGLAMAEDWEMYVRVALRGAFVAHAETVLDYRVHPVSAMRRASLGVQDFEPALQRVFGDAGRYADRIDPATLRGYELHNRAAILRVLASSSNSVGKSLQLLVAFGRLAVRARFDRLVMMQCVRATLRVGRGVVHGQG